METASVARDLMASATQQFHSLLANPDPVPAAIDGLEFLSRAAMTVGDLSPIEGATALRSALIASAPFLAACTQHSVSPERVYIGVGAAAGLLVENTPYRCGRISHTRLLAALLEADLQRRYLAAQGDPFLRFVRICAAQAQPFTTDMRLH